MRKRAAASALLSVLAACGSHGAQPAPSAAPPAAKPSASATPLAVRVQTKGGPGNPVTIVETVHGRKVYTIRALSGELQRQGGAGATGDLEQPHITFVDKTGKTTIADAPKAHIAERDKSVLMTGGVHARTSDGILMTCDSLRYDGNTERFLGVGNVVLTGPNLSMSGDRLDGDVRLQDVKMTQGGS